MPQSARGAIGRCRGCSTILPLRWPAENEVPTEWVCIACGERYRGIRIQNLPREYEKNVRPADAVAVSGPAVDEVEQHVESFLNPSRRDDSLPHPITIAFPDRSKIVCELDNAFSRSMDDRIGRGGTLERLSTKSPFADKLSDLGNRPYDQGWVRRICEQVVQSTSHVRDQFAALKDGLAPDLEIFRTIVRDQLRQILEDKDVFACLGIRPHLGDYPSRHALQVSMLAMSIGLSLKWDDSALFDLGLGCLIHDAGMQCSDNAPHEKKGILSTGEFSEIAKHVVIGFGALEHRSAEIPERALLVAYQIHERCNGTGYPRGYTTDQIHPLARVAAIADVFVALMSPRPHRPGMVPYHAIKKIMQDTERGLFDKDSFRGLLETVSIFPLGSYIALNDGRVGRVLRPTAGRYDRPIVEVWRRNTAGETPAIVDLANDTTVSISNSLASLDG